MREYLTTDDISNTICMMRSAFKGTILVVEGVTDMRLYGKFTEPGKVQLVIAHSKDKVRDSVSQCNRRREDPRIIGIMDADLDSLEGRRQDGGPVFETDTRDAESMMVMSEAFDSVLWEFGDREKIETFEKRYGPIRDRVLEAAYPLGLLMYVSDKNRYGLCFKDLEFRDFISRRDLSCDLHQMVRSVLGNTRYVRTDSGTLLKKLSSEMRRNRPFASVCRGHDLVDVLVIGLRDAFGAYNSKNIREGELGGALRMSYDFRLFSETGLYARSSEWCGRRKVDLWRPTEPGTPLSSDRQPSP